MSFKREITDKSRGDWHSEEVLIFTGARQAGKTTILQQIKEELIAQDNSCHWISLEDPSLLAPLNDDPDNLFKIIPKGTARQYVFVDEIQYLRNPSGFLKYHYDLQRQQVKLIVTGSSAFYLDRRFGDSLAGRKKIFPVNTLSFREFLLFKNMPELAGRKDFNDLLIPEKEELSIAWHEYIRYGGYPRVVLAKLKDKENVLRDLAYSYVKKDIFEANIHDEDDYFRLLQILCRQTGSLVNAAELANTLNMNRQTTQKYLEIMHRSYHLAFIKPFYNNLRKELTKMPKVYGLDTGLCNFFAGNLQPYVTRNDKGPLLENSVFRQLLEKNVYDWSEIKYWRTADGHEVAFVTPGMNLALEVKANPAKFNSHHWEVFHNAYPEISLNVVTLDKQADEVKSYPLLDPWEI